MRFLVALTLLVSFFLGYGQSSQAEYLEAKRQFGLGNYAAAKLGFRGLLDNDNFGPYASFYYALSAYKNKEFEESYDMWRQVDVKHPTWNQKHEVTYWLTKVSFELKRFDAGFKYLESLPKELRHLILQETLLSIPVEEFEQIYEENPENESMGRFLAGLIMELPYAERDRELLRKLGSRFEIPSEQSDLPELKKDNYSVAVVLPFMFESFDKPQTVLRNSIIWNLYEGMKLAEKELRDSGIGLTLFPFDTKKNTALTERLVKSGSLENADVIIGPLLTGPSQVVSDYIAEEKITMINPLSSNDQIIANNPYSYLFKPAYSTQGRVAAVYAAKQFRDNRKAFVFFETERDSIVAGSYKDEIEKAGFFVINFQRLTGEIAQQIQRDFSEKYEVRLDINYSKEEIDSIASIPGRIVQTRPLRERNSGKLIMDDEGNTVPEYYEERFRVQEDSIGHMFVASSSNLIANNFISLSEVRNDSIGIIGFDDWLNFSTIAYNQLERLEIAFVSPSLFKKETELFHKLKESFIKRIGREPDEYHLIGFELVYQLGQLLNQHGKYFQKGLITDETIKGYLMHGLQYGQYQDNQVVPITKLINLKLVNQHTIREED